MVKSGGLKPINARDEIKFVAGIDKNKILEENSYEMIRAEEAESRLISSFVSLFNTIDAMKYMFVSFNGENKVDPNVKTKLREIAIDKTKLLRILIEEVFGKQENERKESEDEE